MEKKRVLIVEDEVLPAMAVQMGLCDMGFQADRIVSSGEEAVKAADEIRPHIVLMDILLDGEMDGIEAGAVIRSRFNTPIIYLTAFSDNELLERAKLTEPFGYLVKPFRLEELRTNIEMALFKHQMEQRLRLSEEKYRELVEHANSVILKADRQGRITFLNEFGQRLFGYTEELVLGKHIMGTLIAETNSAGRAAGVTSDFIRNPEEYPLTENESVRQDGDRIWISWTNKPLLDEDGRVTGVLSVGTDITARKQMEEEIKTLNEDLEKRVSERTAEMVRANLELRRERESLKRTSRALRALGECNLALIRETEETTFLRKICQVLVDVGGYRMAWVGYALDDEEKTVEPVAHAGFEEGYLKSVRITWADEEAGRGPTGTGIRTGTPQINRDSLKNPYFHLWRPEAVKRGYASSIALPLTVNDRVIGALMLYATEPDAFDQGELELLTALADDVGYGIAALRTRLERERVQEDLDRVRRQYELILTSTWEGIYGVDLDGNYTFVNPAAARMLGYQAEELIGRPSHPICLPGSADGSICLYTPEDSQIRSIFMDGKPLHLTDGVFRRRDGTGFPVELAVTPIVEKGRIAGGVVTFWDITERKRAGEERLRLATAVEQATEGIAITDVRGIIQYVNPAFERMTGYARDELIGQNPGVLKSGKHDRRFYEDLWRTIKNGRVWKGRMVNKRKNGVIYYEDASISPLRDSDGNIINFVAVKRDVTEHLELSKRLVQSQKMEAIGTLAGGIAHDFNNMLFAMTGYTELAMEGLPKDSGTVSDLRRVLEAGKRAAEMVRQILTFSRQAQPERRSLDLAPIIKEGLQFLRSSIPTTIGIRHDIQPELGKVFGDAVQIHQVLMNFCTNAAHAMRDTKGVLSVELAGAELDQAAAAKLPGAVPGEYVRLTVSDTGHGIPPEMLDRIFEPYFTTKPAGEGTGLGLSVVHGIVKSHGGAISVISKVGKGTTFHVYLPLIKMEADQGQESSDEMIPTGKERILLVDDERILVEMGRLILERLGYEVESRTNSVEALVLFRADPDRFDLIITDLTMPKITGEELATEMKKIKPDIPIILCTGFSESITEARLTAAGIDVLVRKPVLKRDIAKVIRELLDRDE